MYAIALSTLLRAILAGTAPVPYSIRVFYGGTPHDTGMQPLHSSSIDICRDEASRRGYMDSSLILTRFSRPRALMNGNVAYKGVTNRYPWKM